MYAFLRPPGIFRRRLLTGVLLPILCGLAPIRPAAAQQSGPARQRSRHFLRGRTQAGAAQALAAARAQHLAMLTRPRASVLTASWAALGPTQVATATFGAVTGRVTSIAIDPADATGNTVFLGTTGGGVWKSVNAAGPAASVTFVPLTDTLPVFSPNAGTGVLPSLSIGALAVANGVVLAGTGDPNDASDSYYGAGVLRSTDGGVSWMLIQTAKESSVLTHSFFGLSFAGFAFSSATPSLVVAAVSQAAEGDLVNAPDQTNSVKGLYYSVDAGQSWQMATIYDGAQIVQTPLPTGQNLGGNAATAVVWNPVRQRFYAAVRYHGFYESTDGTTWTRLAHQPGTGLTLTACPTNPGLLGNPTCPLFRGALAVQPVTGDTFALSVDLNNLDQGLWQDACALTGSACAASPIQFGTRLPSTAFETTGTAIPQADYDLTLAAAPAGTDTLLYTGTVDLFRCSLAAGCLQRNTTNVQNGCAAPAKVSPGQHAIAVQATAGQPLLYLGNDGGLWRSTDGVNQQAAPCSADDATHFQNLNPALGSLAEVVSFAQDPADPATLLAGLGANGTAGTGSAISAWPQLATGEGGTVAIDPASPSLWYLSTAAGVSIGRCAKGSACAAADFAGLPVIGESQVANDLSAIDAPWLLDPGLTANLLIGTCRVWRGSASNRASWTSSNLLGRPFAAPLTSTCTSSSPVVRSLAAGGPLSNAASAPNAGSQVLYAGLAGRLDGGGAAFGGHLFSLTAGGAASGSTVWTDTAQANVTNDPANQGIFNPGGFDLSSIAVDPHDATGATAYATVMGFAGNGISAPHLYRTVDAGAHWLNISSNLPNAPANSVAVDPNDANTVYVALDTGVYVATQVTTCAAANCWSVFGASLPNAPVIALAAAPHMPTGDGRTGELRAATYGRGIWQIPLLTALSPTAPAMALSPLALTFATQQVSTASPAQTVTVTNTGTAALAVSSVTTTGDFTVSGTCLAAPIAAGANCAVNVTFLPSAIGTRTGVLTVYGNVPGGQATAALTGIGAPPAAILLNPVALTFPATTVGATSAAQNITVSNTGGVPSIFTGFSATGDFRISANTCAASLPPATGCTLSVVFAPTASGSRTGTLTVIDDAGAQIASLTGSGTAPATDALSATVLTFAAQLLNTASPSQQLLLTNAGDVALTLISAQIATGDFLAVNGCGASLNAHSSCAIAVAFLPKNVGAETGSLTLTDQYRTQTVTLNGTGLAPPGVSLSPSPSLTFAATAVGSTSAAQTVTLTNNGGVALNLGSIVATGDFTLGPGVAPCGASLSAGTACTVQVAFAPTLGGGRTGTLSFTDNAANSPQTLSLSGAGVDFALSVSGSSTVTVSSGNSAVYSLLLTSASGVPGTATLACTGAPAHARCTVTPASPALGGSATLTVTITTGLTVAAVEPPHPDGGRNHWLACLLPFGILVARRRRAPAGTIGAMLLCAVFASGCGAARTIPVTQATTVTTPTIPGSYPITVSASSASLTRSVSLTLIVQ